MKWTDVRAAHPDRWLVIEAIDAYTVGTRRIYESLDVIDVCRDGASAMRRYRELRRRYPERELAPVFTGMEELDIVERWIGIRGRLTLEMAA
jgi:hypothetical protein